MEARANGWRLWRGQRQIQCHFVPPRYHKRSAAGGFDAAGLLRWHPGVESPMNRAARFLAMGLCAACATSFSLCAQTNAAAQSQARRARGPRDERGVYKARLVPHWFSADSKFWYRNDLRDGKKEFVLVDCEKGSRQAAFDHDKLAVALSKPAGQQFPADRLPFSSISFSDDAKTLKFDAAGKSWECDLENYSCKTTGEASAALLFDA